MKLTLASLKFKDMLMILSMICNFSHWSLHAMISVITWQAWCKHIIVDVYMTLYWHHFYKSSINKHTIIDKFCSKWTSRRISRLRLCPWRDIARRIPFLQKEINNSIYLTQNNIVKIYLFSMKKKQVHF